MLGAPSGVSGNGTIASITFKVVGTGSSPLNLVNTKLSDPNAIPITHEAYDGYFSNVISIATLSVNPPNIINPSLSPSTNFTVNININNTVDLKSWEFKLFYQNSMLNVTNIEFGPFLESSGGTSQLVKQLTDNYNSTHGIVWLNDTLLSGGANGDGTIASITFHVIGTGESYLTLTDTVLINAWGYTINHETYSGYFNNVLMAKLFVNPPEIFNPNLTPGSQVNVTIMIANVTNLYGFHFNLTYNPEILKCLAVVTQPYPSNETHYNTIETRNDFIGEIYFNMSYYPPAQPITSIAPFAVAKIFFQVAERGASYLRFHDTALIDINGAPIVHETQDGYICILIRDIAITNLAVDKNEVYPGSVIQGNVTVKNEGNITESFEVNIYYGEASIANLSVVNLPPNNETTITFTWNTTGFSPCYNETLKAEAPSVPYETDLSDNIYTDGIVNIKILGDVNGDGFVGIFDVTTAAAVFGSSVGEPSWDERADINFDGIVDIFDLVIIATHFGTSFTP